MTILKFPDGFLWGSATSAHQVEGNNTLNDWHRWEEAGNIKGGQRSGLACDHYNRFRQDIDLLASLQQNAYRFSVEWSRIQQVSDDWDDIVWEEISHYVEVLKYLRQKGIKTFVTLHHFTNPTWFDWERDQAPHQFSRFARLMAGHLGRRVDYWCTINEPNILAKHGYFRGDFPPGRRDRRRMFRVLDNMIAGHELAYAAIHEELPQAMVGFAQNCNLFEPAGKSAEDKLAADLNHQMKNMYFLDRTKFDFLGINYYRPKWLRFDPMAADDFYGVNVPAADRSQSDLGWEIYPDGLAHLLCRLPTYTARGRGPLPVFITENGIADADDSRRLEFIKGHLRALHAAIRGGVNVQGYLHWSLLDNFEWGFGFGPRFGLVEVDYATQERTPRPSALWYAEVCRKNALEI